MYAYSAMASYFARDNVALLGFAKVMAAAASSLCVHIARMSMLSNSIFAAHKRMHGARHEHQVTGFST